MNKCKFLPLLIFICIISLTFTGCFNNDSDDKDDIASVPKADNITIDNIKNEFETPTGNGTVPDNKDNAFALVNDINEIDGVISDALEQVFDDKNLNKNKALSLKLKKIKTRIKSGKSLNSFKNRIKSSASEEYKESDSIEWDEPIDLNLAEFTALYATGTITGNWSGSWSWTYITTLLSETKINVTNDDNYKEQLSLKFNEIKPAGKDLTVNGFENANSNEISYVYGIFEIVDSTLLMPEFYIDTSNAFSYRSGFSVSGDTYSCYILTAIDLSLTLKFKYIESVHGGMSDEEFYNELMKGITLTGNMSIQVYDKDENLVYSDALDSDEIMDEFFDVDLEEYKSM